MYLTAVVTVGWCCIMEAGTVLCFTLTDTVHGWCLSAYIPRPFPHKKGADHVLAVAIVAPRDTPHLKPGSVQDGHGGHFPFKCLSPTNRDYVGSIL